MEEKVYNGGELDNVDVVASRGYAITEQQIRSICPGAPKGVDAYIPYLNKFLSQYKINTPKRIQAFIAQLAQESGQFRYTSELADGKAYEGRKDLGNIHPGDGVKFKGHGLIQVTGRDNHLRCGKALGLDLINNPLLLTTPQYAVQSACWFWESNGLNEMTDLIDDNDQKKAASVFERITRKINGGLTHIIERKAFWEKAKALVR
jgi:putative chitinase